MICQKEALNKLLCATACSKCFVAGQVSLEVFEGSSLGLSVQAMLVCLSCKETFMEDYLCQRVGRSRQSETPFEVNLRGVMAFRSIGCGHSALRDWCGRMNMP